MVANCGWRRTYDSTAAFRVRELEPRLAFYHCVFLGSNCVPRINGDDIILMKLKGIC